MGNKASSDEGEADEKLAHEISYIDIKKRNSSLDALYCIAQSGDEWTSA